ncbi:hypothetical protein JMJ77_0009649 [Colletotrichum scovillei]|uniref:Uncharacterized protein n=1 Tax=Colletotrichum scovillei TaxID=1209932 RepID=A0A9P7QZS2_9PEZI|nr:hypothetical protein JMJ77_0009649 [Colletotrichum scovillei]KAG7052728.1 hypothetical protein JMJ78_0005741 [Colletotrichum scovillei]KAG7065023.1 hypothetical protein JMJ76_0012777 [Colletotrichum scovillei]
MFVITRTVLSKSQGPAEVSQAPDKTIVHLTTLPCPHVSWTSLSTVFDSDGAYNAVRPRFCDEITGLDDADDAIRQKRLVE